MPHSAVFGSNCKTNGNADTDVSIHKVPSDNKRKIELENAQRPEEPRLYSLHFVPVAFQAFNQPPNQLTGADGDKRRLRENAVPTVFPHNYSKRPREAMVKRSHKSLRKETVDGIMLLCKLPDAAARMYEAVWDPADVHRRITLDHNYADVQQLLVIKEEVPSNLSPSLEQQGPGPVHIKEEQEEVLSSQEQEQLHVLEEADVTRFKDSAVKSESEEDKPPSSQLNQSQTGDTAETETPTNIWTEWMKSERGGEDVGAQEPARNSNPNTHFQPHADETSTETEGGDKACMRLHRKKQTLVCDICGQSFTQGVNLNSHMRGHTGEKPYSCNVCEKTFARDCNLSRHMIVHTREKPFACHVCDLRFKHRASLKMHMRVHTGVKPFACVVCGGRFNRSGTLKIHMRLHTGEKPFACDVCGHSYTVKSNLTKHMRVHSQQRPCGCCICGKTFNREAHLKTHMTVHTRKTPWM